MVKVAVVMPVYNHEEYLKGAIESILEQTFKDIVLYILDDASKDQSYRLLQNYQSDRIKIYKNETNKKIVFCLNLLIEEVLKDFPDVSYIARQDADDYSHKERISKQVEFLDNNDDHGLVGSAYHAIDCAGNIVRNIDVLTTDEEIRRDFFFQNWFGHGSLLFKKEAIINSGLYDETFSGFFEDYELISRIMLKGYKVANLHDYLYFWRFDPISENMEKQKIYKGLIWYNLYCKQMGIEFDIKNFRKNRL